MFSQSVPIHKWDGSVKGGAVKPGSKRFSSVGKIAMVGIIAGVVVTVACAAMAGGSGAPAGYVLGQDFADMALGFDPFTLATQGPAGSSDGQDNPPLLRVSSNPQIPDRPALRSPYRPPLF